MRLPISLIVLITAVLAQEEDVQRSPRSPQGQIKYTDTDGMKVNWKFFAPQNQWRAHLESSQRAEREDASSSQPQQHPQPQSHVLQPQPQQYSEPDAHQPYPKPYSAVPAPIKQLILQTYEPQRPYVDPSAFVYNSNYASPQQYEQQLAETSSPHYEQRREYEERPQLQGKIEYKEEQRGQYEQQVREIAVPVERMPLPAPPKLYFDKSMPVEIQQLLQYQAHAPYDVIANRILYKPKSLFIPKPLSDEVKQQYRYPSKVYYVKNEDAGPSYETEKPVEEVQGH